MASYHGGPGQAPTAFYQHHQHQPLMPMPAEPHHHHPHQQQLGAHSAGGHMWMPDGSAPAPSMRQDPYSQPASNGGSYWPMPQAPRLTAAAPRITTNAAMYYDPQAYMQPHPYAGHYSTAPHAPTPTHWSSYGGGQQQQPGQYQQQQHHMASAPGAHPQVQHHQQLEHQILLHHQLSKLQQDGRRLHGQPPYQPQHHFNGAPPVSGRASSHHAEQRWSHRPSRSSVSSRPQSYAPSARTSPGFSRESGVAGYGQDHWGQPQPPPQQQQQPRPYPRHHHHGHHQSFDASAWHAGVTASGPWQEPAPLLQQPAHPPTWTAAHQQTYAPRFGVDAEDAQRQQQQQQQPATGSYALAPVAPQARAGIDANWAEVRASIGAVGTSAAWDDARYRAGAGAQAVQPTIAIPEEAAAVATQQPVTQQKPDVDSAKADGADNAGGAAPASPETLDKSSTPLSSYGAEIIWSACAALLDPTILLDFVGAEPLTSDASSSVSTPATSPHQRNADGEVKGPSTANAEAAGSLLRLAVDGALAGNSSQGSAVSNAIARAFSPSDMGISSPGSSISSSEPGTPPSLVNSAVLAAPADGGRLPSIKGLGLDAVTMGRLSSAGSPMDTAVSSPRSAAARSRRASVQQPPSRASYSAGSPRAERCTAQVRGVLRLISPEWRWSLNDDTLPSLESSLRPEAISAREKAAPTSTSMRRRTSGSSMRESGGNPFLAGEINPAFRRFAHQVLAQTLLSPTAFLLALLYAARVPFLASQRGEMEAEAKEIFVQPPSVAPFKLFALGAIMANKHLDDNTYLNKTWHEVTGIPLAEINRMERWYLEKCGYETTVPENVWIAFLKRVRAREEHKLAMSAAARRARIVSHMRASAGQSALPRRISDAQLPSPASEEVSKRLLMSVDEALAALGHVAPLDLAEPSLPTITPARNSPEPAEGGLVSPATQHSPERGRMRRPTAALQHVHHHCHSAPALPVTLGDAALHQAPTSDDDDLFQEEDGPYRPHAARSSVELSLAGRRSNSDWAGIASARSNSSASAVAAVRPAAPSTLLMDHLLARERSQGLTHAH